MRKVLVAGAGASGLLAAISAARNNANVILLERNDFAGKKLLATGNGRCNLSNENLKSLDLNNIDNYYYGSCKKLAISLLNEFGVDRTLSFFREIGIEIKHRDDLIYPFSDQAVSVRDALVMELISLNVDVRYNHKLTGINKITEGYVVNIGNENTGDMSTEQVDSIVLAMGSRAYPVYGSDGFGYKLCKKLGVEIEKPLPALCKCMSSESWLNITDGARWNSNVSLYSNNQLIKSERGEVQFLNNSLSGIVIFNLSGLVSKMLENGDKVHFELDLFPEYSQKELKKVISDRIESFEKKGYPLEKLLNGLLNDRLASAFVEKKNLSEYLKKIPVAVDGVAGFNQSQVCCGGIKYSEISDDLELKKYPGIYVAGELIDINGICGGYNLQFAFSAGYIAGEKAALG